MIREYALDPDIVTNSIETLQRVVSDFSPDKGRVIGAFPCDWDKVVYKGIGKLKLKSVERKTVIERLKVMKKTSLVKRDSCNTSEEESWLKTVLDLHKHEPFSGIFIDEDSENDNVYNYLRMLDSQPIEWDLGQTASVERKADNLADSIGTSLHLARQVILVDPYFDPAEERYRLPLLAFIKKINNGRFNVRKISIHTCEHVITKGIYKGTRKSKATLEKGLNERVQPYLIAGLKIELSLWPFSRMHDRFILTDMVGYSFGHGLSEADKNSSINVNISRLDNRMRTELWREFSRDNGSNDDPIIVEGD